MRKPGHAPADQKAADASQTSTASLAMRWGRAAGRFYGQGKVLHGYKLPKVHVTCAVMSSGGPIADCTHPGLTGAALHIS